MPSPRCAIIASSCAPDCMKNSRAASIRHAQAAILHGQDDALALTFAGFSIGMDGHDRAAAFAAFEAALAVSPSSALTYILGSVILGWAGEAERAIEWGERGLAPQSVRSLGLRRIPRIDARHISTAAATRRRPRPPTRPSSPIRPTASPTCCWRRRSRSSDASKTPRLLRHGFWNCSRHSATAGNLPAWIVRPRLPPL